MIRYDEYIKNKVYELDKCSKYGTNLLFVLTLFYNQYKKYLAQGQATHSHTFTKKVNIYLTKQKMSITNNGPPSIFRLNTYLTIF